MLARVFPVSRVFVEQTNPTILKAKTTGAPRINRSIRLPLQPHTEDNYLQLLNKAYAIVDDESEERLFVKTVRFVLDASCNILLSHEGRPGEWTLKHNEMADHCITSGDLMFDAQNKLRMVSNIQAGFLPSASSLQFLMIVLIKNNKIALADEITFRLYQDSVNTFHAKISLKDLKAELSVHKFYKRYGDINSSSSSSSLAATTQSENPFVTPELPKRTLNPTSTTASLMQSLPTFSSVSTNTESSRLNAVPSAVTFQGRRSIQLSVAIPSRPTPQQLASALPAITVQPRQTTEQLPVFIRSVIASLDAQSSSSTGYKRTAFHAPESKDNDQPDKRLRR